MNPALLALILTQAQANWLTVSYNEGQKYGLPKYTQAIILVESSACLHRSGDDHKSLGCGQLQLSTARKTCRCKINSSILEKDNARNIKITAHFLSDCFVRFWPDRNRAILCYNVGIPAASKATASQILKSRYVARVLKAEKELSEIKRDGE